MLRVRGRLPEGGSVLVQGAGGGLATAAVALGVAMGARVYATSRDPGKRDRIAGLGAQAVAPGDRLPERVDVVIETVGAATFEHSLRCVKRGGRIVVSGATAGYVAHVDLRRVFFQQLEILGSTMGTRDELAALVTLCAVQGIRPIVDSVYGFSEIRRAFEQLESGNVFGKVVLDHSR
jgi:D-arabinose 1-dehydrogenase-like Zn-dependent alcohol dehydrogenase